MSFDIEGSPAIADGYMVWFNGYDNQIYSYGKAPSALTVTAPQSGVEQSKAVVISGTILDISAGTQQDALKSNYPYGVPAISDASQSAWMNYLYQQQPTPTNATGVPVTINVLDSNNNFRTVGTATSNIYGTYSLSWTPDISGNYTVIANFAGTNSYYPSTASTAFFANGASATSAPTPTSATNAAATSNDVLIYVAVAAIAIIIAIAIATVLMLKKKA